MYIDIDNPNSSHGCHKTAARSWIRKTKDRSKRRANGLCPAVDCDRLIMMME